MYPSPFLRVLVANLALKIPVPPAAVHSASPCFAKVRLDNSPHQTAAVPLVGPDDSGGPQPDSPRNPSTSTSSSFAARFHLSKADLARIHEKPSFFSSSSGRAKLKVSVYTSGRVNSCGLSSVRLLGKIALPLDLKGLATDGYRISPVEFHSGWVSLGKRRILRGSSSRLEMQLFLSVKAELDPRFVFEFDGEPECSPQVFQVQGNIRQPVFTCKFSCRSTADRSLTSSRRSMNLERSSSRSWLKSFGSERERPGKERKGWSVTVHDLSGSPVALASMVTPFVASPGTARVSRSNPGAWLVLSPGEGTWNPWGRLEAWRERGAAAAGDSLGYRFELLPDIGPGINLAESTISTVRGGQFIIDLAGGATASPRCSPRRMGSGAFSSAVWPFSSYRGFVMSAKVAGEGRGGHPTVDVGVHHVGCAEDAAVFVALAAAVDLSMDACRLFSHRLRKELVAPYLLGTMQ